MAQGFIKAVYLDRNCAYLAPLGEPDVFVHRDQLMGLAWDEQLRGRRFEFEIVSDARGRTKAVNVRALD